MARPPTETMTISAYPGLVSPSPRTKVWRSGRAGVDAVCRSSAPTGRSSPPCVYTEMVLAESMRVFRPLGPLARRTCGRRTPQRIVTLARQLRGDSLAGRRPRNPNTPRSRASIPNVSIRHDQERMAQLPHYVPFGAGTPRRYASANPSPKRKGSSSSTPSPPTTHPHAQARQDHRPRAPSPSAPKTRYMDEGHPTLASGISQSLPWN